MSRPRPRILVTSGEPAGIGPDICLALAQSTFAARLIVACDRDLLMARARTLGIAVTLAEYDPERPVTEGGPLEVMHIALASPSTPGRLDSTNAPYVLAMLRRALDGCISGEFDAMVTAPVNKGIINDAGVPFTGHTEFLAENTRSEQVVMLLVGGGLRVALATTHVPLQEVPRLITGSLLESVCRTLHAGLRSQFGIPSPRIAVTGLNPHAGESGHLGLQDRDIIAPALENLRTQGMNVSGPMPADTVFTPRNAAEYDAVLTMYHDQGLPVLKYASFGAGVNVTLGLPIIRTSVDHGTALDIAGTGRAESGSLMEAVRLAYEMVLARARSGHSAT